MIHARHYPAAAMQGPSFNTIQLRQIANGWQVKLPLFDEDFAFQEATTSAEIPAEREIKIAKDESIFAFTTFDEVVTFLKTKIQEEKK